MRLVYGRVASGKRYARGWSLVEMLVVVAGIAILAGILFPVFGRARRVAYQMKCASNLQQLSDAFHTYATDWDDRWPCPGGLVGDRSYWSQSGNGGIEGYVKQRGNGSVFCCPLMPNWRSYYSPRTYTMNSYLRDPADVEYDYNHDGVGCVTILKGIRPSNIQRMSETVLLFEGLPLKCGWENISYYVYIYRCCNWTGTKGYNPQARSDNYVSDPGTAWHGLYNNYLYCDGHLRARTPGTKTRGVLSTHKEMYEWYVDKVRFETQLWPAWARQGVPYE
jgi:prepilin-type processing-associated H-X9-DG protein